MKKLLFILIAIFIGFNILLTTGCKGDGKKALETRMARADTLWNRGQLDEAMKIWHELADSLNYIPAKSRLGRVNTAITPKISQNYEEGISYLKDAAPSDTDALDRLMFVYLSSDYCEGEYKDLSKCKRYAEMAVRKGVLLADAYFCLGNIASDYRDYNLAYYNWSKSASYGASSAYNNIGWAYYYGHIGRETIDADTAYYDNDDANYEPNYVKARQNFEKALKIYPKDDYSLRYLGIIYRDGKGVAKDTERAKQLLKKAADLGNESAKSEYAALII